MEKVQQTVSFKSAWGKCADMFDISYGNVIEINNSNMKTKSDSQEMREWMKEARCQSSEMRNLTMAGLKMAISISTTPGLKESFVSPETKPELKSLKE